MSIITSNKRYLPHEILTKEKAVLLYRSVKDVSFVTRRYHISKASLMRWNALYDGTRESLAPKSHKPKSVHPRAHTDEEIKWIKDYHRRNPNIGICELYGKLREEKAYSRHPGSLYRVFVRLGFRKKVQSTKKLSKHNGHYDTPNQLGIKWQLDVKYVPTICYAGNDSQRFYQYTIVEEASRKRFIYAYLEQSGYSTVDFVKRAITYFGYAPKTIQTDNGVEFHNLVKTDRIHTFDIFCNELGIKHQLIRPRTPWHNGKVERSHRNDQRYFYDWETFRNINELNTKLKAHLEWSNNKTMRTLGRKSPIQMLNEKLQSIKLD